MKSNIKSQLATFRKVLRYISRYRYWLVCTLIMAVIVVALTLYVPILVGRAIDNIIEPGNVAFEAITKILLTVGISVAVTSAAQWIMNMINNKIACEVVRDMRNEAFRKVQKLPFDYLDTHPAGETVSRIITDVDVLSEGLLASGAMKPPMLQALPVTFGWPQLVTALIGGAVALLIVPVLKKALHK